MSKEKIFIRTKEGDFYDYADVKGGLAVHREYDHVDKCFGKDPELHFWQITHTLSGFKVPFHGYLFKKKTAIKLRNELLELNGWLDFNSVGNIPQSLKESAGKILSSFKGDPPV